MATCKVCGARLKPYKQFCAECGSPVDEIVTEEEETEEEAEDISASLPKIKSIEIIKPKDISVLKPKVVAPVQRKTTAVQAPVPTAAMKEAAMSGASQAPTFKPAVPDIELPEENRYAPSILGDENGSPVAKSFVNKRNLDFEKEFYSDNSLKHKTPTKPVQTYEPPKKKKKEKAKKNPWELVVVLACLGVFSASMIYLYNLGYLNGIIKLIPGLEEAMDKAEEAADAAIQTESVNLTFEHKQSVQGSVILKYSCENNPDGFDFSRLTKKSSIIIDYTSTVYGDKIIPIVMTVSNGTEKIDVTSSQVTEDQIVYDYDLIIATLEASGEIKGGITSITSIEFRGVGMPTDITAIEVTECLTEE